MILTPRYWKQMWNCDDCYDLLINSSQLFSMQRVPDADVHSGN